MVAAGSLELGTSFARETPLDAIARSILSLAGSDSEEMFRHVSGGVGSCCSGAK